MFYIALVRSNADKKRGEVGGEIRRFLFLIFSSVHFWVRIYFVWVLEPWKETQQILLAYSLDILEIFQVIWLKHQDRKIEIYFYLITSYKKVEQLFLNEIKTSWWIHLSRTNFWHDCDAIHVWLVTWSEWSPEWPVWWAGWSQTECTSSRSVCLCRRSEQDNTDCLKDSSALVNQRLNLSSAEKRSLHCVQV